MRFEGDDSGGSERDHACGRLDSVQELNLATGERGAQWRMHLYGCHTNPADQRLSIAATCLNPGSSSR